MSERYTLLLVDDEEIIRDGISRKINWEEEGFQLLTPCEDGEAAIQIIQQEEPDVVITDICMPRVDGLEVARYVIDNFPDILVIILSGYEDFEYARKAITFNVHEYLLKPLSARKIRELLKRIHQELDRRKAYKLDVDRLLFLQEENKQILQERALCRTISGPVRDEQIHNLITLLPSFNPDIQWFSVICLDIDDPGMVQDSGQLTPDLYLLAMREIVDEFLKKMKGSYLCQPYEPRLLIVLGDKDEENLTRNARFTGNQIHKILQDLPGYTVSAGIGSACSGLGNLFKSFNQALYALENRMIAGDNGVFYYHRDQSNSTENNRRFSQIQSSLKTVLRQQRGEEVTSLVGEFCSLLKDSGLTVSRIRLEIDKLIFSIIDFLDSLSDGDYGSDESDITEKMAVLSKKSNLDDVEIALNQLLLQISENLREKRRNYPEAKVYDIQEYLKENYALKDLSVESITSRFFISPSYLSKLFKQYTGNTFVEYLTELRVSRACELLKTSNRKLFEIAEMVGYSDPGYFTSIFKKYRGVTMSRYREQL
jgi:two-component system response regulator YesN